MSLERSRDEQLSLARQQTEAQFAIDPEDRVYQRTYEAAHWTLAIGSFFIPVAGQEKAGAALIAKVAPRLVRGASRVVRAARRIFGKGESPSKQDETSQFRFPENPNDLLPELPRDDKGHIYPNEVTRIRPEQHPLKAGESYCPRHHGQHYHIDIRINSSKGWNKKGNTYKLKPVEYESGQGTGFLPGETFPGL